MALASVRPRLIEWAVWLSAINAVGGILATAFWPDLEDRGFQMVVATVLAALMLTTAWFLWNGNRWGAIGGIVVHGLNILMAVPAFFFAEPASLAIGAAVSILLSIGTIVFTLMPEGRAFWSRQSTPLTA